MSASPLTILPQHAGQNLAELSPLLKLGEGDKDTSTSLQQAFKELFDHHNSLESSTWDEMYKAGEEVAHFMAGRQFLMPNPFKGGAPWLPYKVSTNPTQNERRALSLMQYHTSGNLEKWLNSNPDVIVTPGVESDEAYESAKAAKVIVDYYEKKFFNNRARLQIEECLEGLTFGSYIWRLRVDPTLKSVTAYRQIFENREVKIGKGWGKCGDCGNEGSYQDFIEVPGEGIYTCPKCHGEALVIPPASDNLQSLVRTEPIELGDFRLELVPFTNCKWDLRVHADESEWLIIRRKTNMSAIRQILGNIRLPEGGGSDTGLDVADRLAYSGQAQAGYSISSNRPTLYKESTTVEEFWVSVNQYGDIRLPKAIKTISGMEIPAHKPLGEVFKGEPICSLGLNSHSVHLGLFPESHSDYIMQGKWYAKKGTGAGRGLQDLTEVQKVLNSDHQKIHTYLRGASTPAMLVAQEAMGEENKGVYIATPGMNIPIPLSKLAEGVTLDQLVRPAFQPTGVPAQFFEFTYNRLQEHAQFASHFLPFTGGIPGVDNSTATGANITQAATDALYTPPLSVKGEIRQGIFEKLVKLYPKHFPVDRKFPMGGKWGRHTGAFLVKANFCPDLTFEVVKDSWLPRNSFRKQQAYAGFGQLVSVLGSVEGLLTPNRLSDLERVFDLELQGDDRNAAESLCFRRVRQMRQLAELVQDPAQLIQSIQPPVSQAEPGHEIKRAWLMEWLDSDDGQEASPVLRVAVEQLILLHTQMAGQQAAMLAGQQGMTQVAGAAPQIMAQQAMQEAQAQQQLGQQEQELGLRAQEAIGQQVVNEADLENKQAEQDLDSSHAERMNAIKQDDREHALAVQNARGQ